MKTTARAAQLATLLADAPAGVRYLSLDCFDTLIWRDVNAPIDVFADLDLAGGAIEPRRRAEGAARREAHFESGGSEIGIEAIHQHFRAGDDEAVTASVAAELAAEARHCFGFAPVIALIADAKARGLEVIVVSDTYLAEPQLRALIGSAAGTEVAASIDRIFCSSDYGLSKAQGLFGPVLEALGAQPGDILHVGDNEIADRKAPSDLGIHAIHFVQFDEEASNRLRLEAAAAAMFDPRIRVSLPAFQPHRPLVALRTEDDPVVALGHDVIGPLLTGYARWLDDEVAAVAQVTGRTTHLLFLLRDGHLPAIVHRMLHGQERAREIEISRFTAMRASFVDAAAIRRHLATRPADSDARTVARQLLFNRDEIDRILPRAMTSDAPAFVKAVLHASNVAKIVTRSARFADKLITHFRRAGVADGDAVVLADLGYNGSVQNLVEPALASGMNVAIAGRYLVLREDVPSGYDKRGWFDTSNTDFRVLDAICDPIALLEQLCTKAQGSVIDYKTNGEPIRAAEDIKGEQSGTRDRAQAACIAYAEAARGQNTDPAADRIAATGLLGRLLFLPSHAELGVLQSFEHDFNCGSDQRMQLMDLATSAGDLRRRGLLYVAGADRMFLPGEVRRHGLPLSLTLLATRRFGLDLKGADFNGAPIKLPVVLIDQRGEAVIEIDAWATHDGYYAAQIPVGPAHYSVAIRWGQIYDWFELAEASFSRVTDFGTRGVAKHAPIAATIVSDAIDAAAGTLFHAAPAGFTLLPPPARTGGDAMLLSVVFRPIVARGDAIAARAAA